MTWSSSGLATRARWQPTATVIAVAVLVGACTPGLDEVASEQPAFESCITALDVSLDGSDDWSTRRSQEFWRQPGTLECALDDLDEDARRDALATAFVDYEDVDDRNEERVAQLEVLAAWGERESRSATVEEVATRAESLLGATWYADRNYPDANGAAQTIVVAAMLARGEFPSYETYLEKFPEERDGVDLRLEVASSTQNATLGEYRRARDVADELVRAIGSG